MKPRYFKTMVLIYIRLDMAESDPYRTLNGALQFMEDQMGNIYAATRDIECVQIARKEAPKELK